MAHLEKRNAELFYQDIGYGVPIVAIHGLMEDSGYWTETGVAEALASDYRVLALDMRGHGRSRVKGRPFGYDVATVASDIGALADALELGDFHLLTHATGGMAAIRFAIASWPRLRSLILTNTGSATLPTLANNLQYERFFGKLRRAARKRRDRPSARSWTRYEQTRLRSCPGLLATREVRICGESTRASSSGPKAMRSVSSC